MQDRGLAAYIAELIGTLFLVFVIGSRRHALRRHGRPAPSSVPTSPSSGSSTPSCSSCLIMAFGAVSGGHFNPAVTIAAAAMRRIDPVDAVVYILAQLSGGVLGALLVKGLLARRGPRRQLRRRRRSAPLLGGTVRTASSSRRSAPSCSCSRSRGGDEPARPAGVGAAAIGTTLGFARDGLRPAHRRLASTRPAGSARR